MIADTFCVLCPGFIHIPYHRTAAGDVRLCNFKRTGFYNSNIRPFILNWITLLQTNFAIEKDVLRSFITLSWALAGNCAGFILPLPNIGYAYNTF